jgi:hypothetical protein
MPRIFLSNPKVNVTPQQILGLAIRLFAIWLALASVTYLGSIQAALVSNNVNGGAAAAYAVATTYGMAALVLWFFPMWIAQALLPRTRHTNTLTGEGHELARVGCALMGLWLFAKTLPTFVWFVFRSAVFVGTMSSFSTLAAEDKIQLAVAVVELAFAVLLVARSGRFADLVVPQRKEPVIDTEADI